MNKNYKNYNYNQNTIIFCLNQNNCNKTQELSRDFLTKLNVCFRY